MAQGNSAVLCHTARNSTNPKIYKFLIKIKTPYLPGWCNLYRVALRSVSGWLLVRWCWCVLCGLLFSVWLVVLSWVQIQERTQEHTAGGCFVSDFFEKSCKKFFLGRKVGRRRNVYALTGSQGFIQAF